MNESPTQTDREVIAKAIEILQLFRGIDPHMSVMAGNCFLIVASQPKLSITEIGERSGGTVVTASRHLDYLGGADGRYNPGKGLVKAKSRKKDHRKKSLRLTKAGRHLLEQIRTVIFR